MKRLILVAVVALSAASVSALPGAVVAVNAQPLRVRVESKRVPPGYPYTLAISVTGADSLAGLLLDIGYNPSKNRATALPTASGDHSTVRIRTNPAAYPDSSGSLRTGWISFPAISGSDSVLALSFTPLGAPGTTDTVRVTVVDAVNQGGATVPATGEPGVVTFENPTSAHEIPEIGVPLPKKFGMAQNFPNPFNSATEVSFSIPVPQHVTLEVYNVLGKKVATLVDERKEAGDYRAHFDASKLPNGVYSIRLVAGNLKQTRKMVIIR